MSRSNYFVVILNLSNYYDDHRLTTRIFVGVEIKTVKDLQQKISRLYHIENFHLLCARNQFLHPSEDIRIIGEGEILWAIPIKSDDCTKSGIQRISPGEPSKYQLSGIGPQLEELRKASSSKASSLKDSSLVSDGSEFVTCKKERTWTANHPTPPPPPHFDEQDDDSFCEEVIKRAPSMNTMKPRVGDIIAFKIFKIGPSYRPELSTDIAGIVEEYNIDEDQIVFEIVRGIDQCKEPEGKFSKKQDGDKNSNFENRRRKYIWRDLIEPRHLYP